MTMVIKTNVPTGHRLRDMYVNDYGFMVTARSRRKGMILYKSGMIEEKIFIVYE